MSELGIIFDTVAAVGKYEIIELKSKAIKSIIIIECIRCHKRCKVTVESVYGLYRLGRRKYLCRSCAGKAAWDTVKRFEASERSRLKWEIADYTDKVMDKISKEEM
jgi:hypothetical protein